MVNKRLDEIKKRGLPTRRGIHGTGNAWESVAYYEKQFTEWIECGFGWVKLLAAGDSQVETVRRMRAAGVPIRPIIRLYNTDCPHNVIAHETIALYFDAWRGPLIIESQFNEFYYAHENSWHVNLPSPSVPDWPRQVARGWAQFAKIVLEAGCVPTTPAIETWRYDDIFVPLFIELIANYPELLSQSVIAMHNRTLNHPVSYAKDPGGWLGWRWFNDYVCQKLKEPLPLLATEAGPEPGWDQDKNYDRVTPDLHARMVQEILATPVPQHYLADCFWLWEGAGAWASASWKRNREWSGGGDLPVVELLKTWRGDMPEPEWSESEAVQRIREWCWNNIYPRYGIPYNPDAAFQKFAAQRGLGAPCTQEMHQAGYAAQGFVQAIVYCREGDWANILTTSW